MYVKNTNPTAVRTQAMVADAFLRLIHEKEYADISVSGLCKAADIARRSFYNNFETKEDVLYLIFDGIFAGMEASVDLGFMPVEEMAGKIFGFVLDNKESLVLFYKRGLIRFAHKIMARFFEKQEIMNLLAGGTLVGDADKKYLSAYAASGLISIVETWIETGFSESVEYLTSLVKKLKRLMD